MQRRIRSAAALSFAAAILTALLVPVTADAATAAAPTPAAIRQGDWILDPAARGVVT